MIVVPAGALLCGFCCVALFNFLALFNKKFSSLTARRAVCEQVPPCADAIALAHAAEGFREAGYELRNINSGKETLQW